MWSREWESNPRRFSFNEDNPLQFDPSKSTLAIALLDAIAVILKVLGARLEYPPSLEAPDLVRNAGRNVEHRALGDCKFIALCGRAVYNRDLEATRFNEPRLGFLHVEVKAAAPALFELQNLEGVLLRIVEPAFTAPAFAMYFRFNEHVYKNRTVVKV